MKHAVNVSKHGGRGRDMHEVIKITRRMHVDFLICSSLLAPPPKFLTFYHRLIIRQTMEPFRYNFLPKPTANLQRPDCKPNVRMY